MSHSTDIHKHWQFNGGSTDIYPKHILLVKLFTNLCLSCILVTLLIPLWVVVVRIIAKSTSDAKDAKWVYALVYTCTNGGRTCTCATQQLCTYVCTCTNVTTTANTVTNNWGEIVFRLVLFLINKLFFFFNKNSKLFFHKYWLLDHLNDQVSCLARPSSSPSSPSSSSSSS